MPRTLTLLVALLALLVAGCGGGSDKDAYVKEFNKAGSTLEKTLTTIGKDVSTGTSGTQIAGKLDQGATALDKAAGDFGSIKPPSDARSAHTNIVSGLKELATLFRQSAQAARKNDVEKLTTTLQSLERSDGAKKIQRAQQELKNKGYKVSSG
jgi:hypothetical protein